MMPQAATQFGSPFHSVSTIAHPRGGSEYLTNSLNISSGDRIATTSRFAAPPYRSARANYSHASTLAIVAADRRLRENRLGLAPAIMAAAALWSVLALWVWRDRQSDLG